MPRAKSRWCSYTKPCTDTQYVTIVEGRGWCDRLAPATGGVATVTVAQRLPNFKTRVWRLRGMSPAIIVIDSACDAKPSACEIQTCMANSASVASASRCKTPRGSSNTGQSTRRFRVPASHRTRRLCLPADSAAGASANCEIPFAAGSLDLIRCVVNAWPSGVGHVLFHAAQTRNLSFLQAFRSADLFAEHEKKLLLCQ